MLRHKHGINEFMSDDNEAVTVITPYFDNHIGNILEFVDLISQTKGEAFSLKKTNEVEFRIIKNRPLSDYFDRMNGMIREFNLNLIYSPEIRLFFQVAREVGWPYPSDLQPRDLMTEHETAAEVFNRLIREIRVAQDSRAYREELRLREYNIKRSHQSAMEYVNALFECHARLLVIRVDLGYPYREDTYTTTRLEAFRKDLERFRKRMERSPIFNKLVGHIFKIEYGLSKGHHLHAFFFFDGSKSIKDEYIAQQIGELWVSATRNQGAYFNCNQKKKSYKYLGIGMINHYEKSKRNNLSRALGYLFELEQFLSYRYGKKERTFSKGKMPNCLGERRGRRRTHSLHAKL